MESSLTSDDPSNQTPSCEILEKETFWKVAHMVCTLLLKQLSKLICYVLTVWIDIKSRWRHNWKSAQVVNSHLVCDPTIRQPGFDLPRQQWSLLNHFLVEQGRCGACRRKWRLTDTDLCPCGETQTIVSHCRIVSPDKTEWQLISATLCGWRRCFVADQLWLMTRVREEEVWI